MMHQYVTESMKRDHDHISREIIFPYFFQTNHTFFYDENYLCCIILFCRSLKQVSLNFQNFRVELTRKFQDFHPPFSYKKMKKISLKNVEKRSTAPFHWSSHIGLIFYFFSSFFKSCLPSAYLLKSTNKIFIEPMLNLIINIYSLISAPLLWVFSR